jgi:taurine dioxygenase
MSVLCISAHVNDFAACITGIDLTQPMSAEQSDELRAQWLNYQVLYFPNQPMTHTQLERFTESLGPFGHNPYITPVSGHPNVLEVRHEPDEPAVPFGSSWHSDWSFQAAPPNATLLHAKVVPPIGGGTHFADGVRALDTLPEALRRVIEGKRAIHSARRPYSHEGYRAGGKRTSMKITPNEDAWQTQEHPIIRTHPESGRQSLFLNPVYTLGIKDMDADSSSQLLRQLFAHMLRPDFIYQHRWAENMLTLWDNRTVMHSAQGGYSGYRRVMHRTTVAGSVPV